MTTLNIEQGIYSINFHNAKFSFLASEIRDISTNHITKDTQINILKDFATKLMTYDHATIEIGKFSKIHKDDNKVTFSSGTELEDLSFTTIPDQDLIDIFDTIVKDYSNT